MKKTIIGLSKVAASATLAACTLANAAVVHFDDLSGDETQLIDAGYAGFDWDNMGTVRADAYPGSGFEAGTVSPSNTAFNRYGATATISTASGNAFEYTGAYFTSAWIEQEISFEGWRNGQLRFASDAYSLDTTTPRWIQLDWAGIDTLVVYNSSPTQWAMDEFTVPEPGSLALMGTSLAGLMFARRRKRSV
jgi:hypothetical protein